RAGTITRRTHPLSLSSGGPAPTLPGPAAGRAPPRSARSPHARVDRPTYTVRVPAHSTLPTARTPARWLLLTCPAVFVALVTTLATWQPWRSAGDPTASGTDAPSAAAPSASETPD